MQVYHGMSYFLPQAQRQHIACISLPGALCYHSWTTSNPEIAWIYMSMFHQTVQGMHPQQRSKAVAA